MAACPVSSVVPLRQNRSSFVGTGENVFVSCDIVASSNRIRLSRLARSRR
jgi:hypothetical protein